MKLILFLALLAVLVLLSMQLRASQDAPKPGALAPDFVLPDQQGALRRLSDFRGKWVVLYFYPKDETPGCTTEACAFRDDWQTLSELNAQVIGISLDDAQSHVQFAAKYHLPFVLLSDRSGEVVARYGALTNLLLLKWAKRYTYVIAPDGKIARAYFDVDPSRHAREVIDFLKSVKK
jgi:peroxiredoxin Q/BCP